MMSLLCTFSVLILLLATANGSDSPLPAALLMKRSQRYCGKALTQALHIVCDGRYYDPNEKIATTETIEDLETNLVNRRDYDSIDTLYPGWFIKGTRFGNYDDLIDLNQRMERQVADECCKSSCSISTLYSYCRGKRMARDGEI